MKAGHGLKNPWRPWHGGRVRGLVLLSWLGLLACASGMAGAVTAAPVVSDADAAFVRKIYAGWYLPRAAEFAEQASRLTATLDTLCRTETAVDAAQAIEPARKQWTRTVQTWEALSAVRGGALLARRSPREIDFTPARPEAIQRAVRSAPADSRAMERVGSPAKGLPALEWLLWTQPVRSQSPECRYAHRVAAEIQAESLALQQAYGLSLQHGWDAQEVEYAIYEFLNLFDAGIQKLWWEDMHRPQQRAATGAKSASFSRSASGTTVQMWQLHWQALRRLAIEDAAAPDSLSLQAYLVAKGHPAEAGRLPVLVAEVDRTMANLDDAKDEAALNKRIGQAAAALKALQQFVEQDMAHALQFIISFFDEDGD